MTTEARPVVSYTHWAPPDGPALLAARCEVRTRSVDRPASHAEIRVEARDATALCYFVPDLIDAALIAGLPSLRVLAGFGKGFDNVDVDAATRCGIWVTNVPDALTEATADLAWALLLDAARNVAAGDAFVRGGGFDGWHPARLPGRRVHGTVLGLLGFGAIGRAVARRAAGFGMTILYADPARAAPEAERSLGARAVERHELFATADHLVIALPLTAATRSAIGAAELARFKPTASLVNVARGSIVDETAVAAALAAGRLGAYAADVFAVEDRQFADRPATIPAELLAAPGTLLTPHLGTAVRDDRRALARAQAENVLAVLDGRRPPGAVNTPVRA